MGVLNLGKRNCELICELWAYNRNRRYTYFLFQGRIFIREQKSLRSASQGNSLIKEIVSK